MYRRHAINTMNTLTGRVQDIKRLVETTIAYGAINRAAVLRPHAYWHWKLDAGCVQRLDGSSGTGTVAGSNRHTTD